MKEDEKQPFTLHLEELRSRLITSFVAVGIGFVGSYVFKEKLFAILTAPLISVMKPGETLIYTNLPEAFFTFLKAALISGLMLASPVIIYQFWMFIAPGLYQKEKRMLIPVVFLSTIFFIGGRRSFSSGEPFSATSSFFPGDLNSSSDLHRKPSGPCRP